LGNILINNAQVTESLFIYIYSSSKIHRVKKSEDKDIMTFQISKTASQNTLMTRLHGKCTIWQLTEQSH
jgi:hypothetical protein